MVRYMPRREAGQYLKDKYGFGSKKSLDKFAWGGGGPEFHKAGARTLYTPEALDAWALSRIGPPQTSTAENASPATPPRDGARPRGRPRKLNVEERRSAAVAAE
jgi:hypothetical protein